MSRRKRKGALSPSRSPRNWAIRDEHGRTRVVIEAASAAEAAERVATLLQEAPPIPRRFTVAAHDGTVKCSWYGDSWFRLRDQVDRAGLDAESRFWRELRDLNRKASEPG